MYEDETRNIQNLLKNCWGGGDLIWTKLCVILIILNERLSAFPLFILSETYSIHTDIYAMTIAFTSNKIEIYPSHIKITIIVNKEKAHNASNSCVFCKILSLY